VPMQLTAAADEARKKPGFVRMIWAPKVLVSEKTAEVNRDPFDIVGKFGELLPTDQIDSDTASRFNEYVLQHLELSGEMHKDVFSGNEDRPSPNHLWEQALGDAGAAHQPG
jgi:hypothetical protein